MDLINSGILNYATEYIANTINGNGTILVHWDVGVSRSATLVAAYLMRKHSIDADEALGRVKDKRKIVSPNSGFVSQLRMYQRINCQVQERNHDFVPMEADVQGQNTGKLTEVLEQPEEQILHIHNKMSVLTRVSQICNLM